MDALRANWAPSTPVVIIERAARPAMSLVFKIGASGFSKGLRLVSQNPQPGRRWNNSPEFHG
jgi:hypothetical protein